LVLSRKQGQSIVIGNEIVVTVREIRGRNVRIAIETPHGVPVHRLEIHQEIVEENRRAAAAAGLGQLDIRLDGARLVVDDAVKDGGAK
jgi:carbon storage regulator